MNSKRKGNAGELEFLHLLEAQGLTAWRNDQRYTGGRDNPDVRLLAGGRAFHCEVKRAERLTLYPFMEQAQRDADGRALPLVAYRSNRKPWLVCMPLEGFLSLIKEKPQS